MFGRSSLFNRAQAACGALRVRHPDNVTIKSIISQLNYLIELDSGKTRDRSRLDTIVIGVLARCEIAHLDAKTAKLLEKVAEEAHKMESAPREASPMLVDEAATPPPATKPSLRPVASWSMRR